MKWLLIACLSLLFIPVSVYATTSAGFVEGLWYSTTTPAAGVPVRIYAAIRNNTGADITGQVTFYDNRQEISRSPVAAINGRIIESWADWTPTTGQHTITARLTAVEVHPIGKPATSTVVANAAATSTIGVAPPPPKPHTPPTPPAKTSALGSAAASNTLAVSFTPRAGLEQYLPTSPITAALGAVTNLTNHAKQALDTYRTARLATTTPPSGSQKLDIPVDHNGFGSVTRSVNHPTSHVSLPHNAFGTALAATGAALGYAWTLFLNVLSWILDYPAVVQLLLMLGILLLLYRTARRYGRRRFGRQ